MLSTHKLAHFPWLDLIRGVSALLVCIGHARNALWVDYAEITSKTWWNIPIYFITGLGHQSVIVFFVLSGFLVGGSIVAAGSRFNWSEYIKSRLVRLWLVLLPALLFTICCDFFTLRFSPNAFDGSFAQVWNSGPVSKENLSWKIFFGNIFFLQTIYFPVFGSNGPLWSLANEFWYYLLFPLLLCSFNVVGIYKFWQRLFMGVFAACIFLWLPFSITAYFLVWLSGVMCALVNKLFFVKSGSIIVGISAAVFCLALAYSKFPYYHDVLNVHTDIYICLSFCIFLVYVNACKVPWSEDGVLGQLIINFSKFSYSLYLFHFPLVVLFAILLLAPSQLQPNFFGYFVLLVLISLCVITAWLSWWIFERNNTVVRTQVDLTILYLRNRLRIPATAKDAN